MNQPHQPSEKNPSFLLQRVISHYRVALFKQLHAQAGIQTLYSPTYPCYSDGGKYIKKPEGPWAKAFSLWFPFKQKEYLCYVPVGRLLKNKPKTLICEAGNTMSSSWILPLMRQFGGLKNTTLLFWGHGEPVNFHQGFKLRLAKALRRWQLKNSDGFLAYTAHDAQFLKALNTQTPIGFTNNTIDISEALKHRKQRTISGPATAEKPFHLLAVGRLMPDKKIPQLIKLVRQLQEKNPFVHLTVVGDGPEKEACEHAAGEALGKSIFVVGAVYDKQLLANHFNQADLFVLLGAAGLGVNDAIAHGVPVLAFSPKAQGPMQPFHHPEIAYVQENITGFLCEEATETAFTENLHALVTQEKRPRDMLANALWQYAPQNLRIEDMAQNMLDFAKKAETYRKSRR